MAYGDTAKRGGARYCGAFAGRMAVVIALMMALYLPLMARPVMAGPLDAVPIKQRHLDASRGRATSAPRSEADQRLVNGWPLYRTRRGQRAFNDAMATLHATHGPAPARVRFEGCPKLHCKLKLPVMKKGWLPAGRLWLSPRSYVLFVRSDRRKRYSLRSFSRMRYFVYHEFHNSTRNTDPYDTISAHKGRVFVSYYMSKTGTDAYGRRYVVIVQIAPNDVRSVHASNMGNRGSGVEVAKNYGTPLEPLQAKAGIILGTIIKRAAPQLRVVNHRGIEGRPMLRAYMMRLSRLRRNPTSASLRLPFTPVNKSSLASAAVPLGNLIVRRGVKPTRAFAARLRQARQRQVAARVAPATSSKRTVSAARAQPKPRATVAARAPRRPGRAAARPPVQLAARSRPAVSPQRGSRRPARAVVARTPATGGASARLAAYLRDNLGTMMHLPQFSRIFPESVAAVAAQPETEVVYLLDDAGRVLGHVQPHQRAGSDVPGHFVYVPFDRAVARETPFTLDLESPVTVAAAALARSSQTGEPQLVEAPQPATRAACASAGTDPDLAC
ncbi:MAG: hypothetical protein AAFR04_06520 [Pseudomonadota bacterium]